MNREIVEGIIDFLDLQSLRDQYVASLPYGKRKLVELGRALAPWNRRSSSSTSPPPG